MTTLIELDDLPGDDEAHQFVGADHGGLPVSYFLVHSPPGAGPELHQHPYPEVFIVHAGQVTFLIADSEITATAGQIAVAPVGVPHRFTNTCPDRLSLTAIHPVAEMRTDWLQR
jgi:quercetin dioxygenase-like cupin family protein